jgi:hypothetical protein
MKTQDLQAQTDRYVPAASGHSARRDAAQLNADIHDSPRQTAQRQQLARALGRAAPSAPGVVDAPVQRHTAAPVQRAIGAVNANHRNATFRVFVNQAPLGGAIRFGYDANDTVGDLRLAIQARYGIAPLVMTDGNGQPLPDGTPLTNDGIYQATSHQQAQQQGQPGGPGPGPGPGPGHGGGGGHQQGPHNGGGGDIWTGPHTVIPDGGVFELEL